MTEWGLKGASVGGDAARGRVRSGIRSMIVLTLITGVCLGYRGAGYSPVGSTTSVTITSPSEGAVVSGTVSVAADVTVANVTKVEFFAGKKSLGSDLTGPYAVQWETTSLADGQYSLRARAQDSSGYVHTSPQVTVTVANSGEEEDPDPGFGLGTVTSLGSSADRCLDGYTCSEFSVACAGVKQSAKGTLGVLEGQGAPRGLVMFFSGGDGRGWWADTRVPDALAMLSDLSEEGFQVVQVRWSTPWLQAASGELAGPARLACRPASIVSWVHENHFVPLGVPETQVGACGFCITGNSGGSSQVSYGLSHYGLEGILDGVFPTSGPPHAALDKGCLARAGEEEFWYDSAGAKTIDRSYGFLTKEPGPCESHDSGFTSRWLADAVESEGLYMHPATRIRFIFGARTIRAHRSMASSTS